MKNGYYIITSVGEDDGFYDNRKFIIGKRFFLSNIAKWHDGWYHANTRNKRWSCFFKIRIKKFKKVSS